MYWPGAGIPVHPWLAATFASWFICAASALTGVAAVVRPSTPAMPTPTVASPPASTKAAPALQLAQACAHQLPHLVSSAL